jgi:hypothetical protein
MKSGVIGLGGGSLAASAFGSDLHAALLKGERKALRLSDSHYLVQWQVGTPLWCVVNMDGLDEHAASCVTFRWRQNCEHLGLIHKLCSGRRAKRPRLRP